MQKDYIPFTKEMKAQVLAQFKLLIKSKYIAVIVDENDEVAYFGLGMPSISKAVQKSGGRLTIPTLFRLLKAVKNPKILDLALVGVMPKYRSMGVNAVGLAALMEMMQNSNVEYCETNLNLETNDKVQAQWKRFDAVNHKRRRSYVKSI